MVRLQCPRLEKKEERISFNMTDYNTLGGKGGGGEQKEERTIRMPFNALPATLTTSYVAPGDHVVPDGVYGNVFDPKSPTLALVVLR